MFLIFLLKNTVVGFLYLEAIRRNYSFIPVQGNLHCRQNHNIVFIGVGAHMCQKRCPLETAVV